MFNRIIKSVIRNSIKKSNYFFSSMLVDLYNKLKIPVHPDIFNKIEYDGKKAIDGAILSGNYNAVKLFLENGAKLNLNVKDTISCINTAILEKNIKMLETLIEYIENRSVLKKTTYDKELASLLTANDMTKKSPLVTAVDLFVKSNDDNEKKELKNCMKLIYNNKLFDKNNSEFYNKLWKSRANFFIDYDKRVLDTIEGYVLNTKNKELINFFLENGLNYVNKAILCVNPKLYTHAAMILKFNEPIKFKDSNNDVAGILYSFESKSNLNNVEKTFKDTLKHYIDGVGSFVSPLEACMKRILITSEDMEKILKNKDNSIYNNSIITGQDVTKTVVSAYKTLIKIKRTPSFSNIRLKKLLCELTSNLENLAYVFSLYTKDINNFVYKDKIIKYKIINEVPKLDIASDEKEGYSIYDFIWKTPKELNLTYKQKNSVIEEFLNVECLKILKENKIIEDDSVIFEIGNFDELPTKEPNDLHDKYHYSCTHMIDMKIDPNELSIRNECDTALYGHKLTYLLEKYNIDIENYHFLRNNCILTLKRALAECGYKAHLEKADKKLNICQKRHPLSVLNRLKEMDICREIGIN